MKVEGPERIDTRQLDLQLRNSITVVYAALRTSGHNLSDSMSGKGSSRGKQLIITSDTVFDNCPSMVKSDGCI